MQHTSNHLASPTDAINMKFTSLLRKQYQNSVFEKLTKSKTQKFGSDVPPQSVTGGSCPLLTRTKKDLKLCAIT